MVNVGHFSDMFIGSLTLIKIYDIMYYEGNFYRRSARSLYP